MLRCKGQAGSRRTRDRLDRVLDTDESQNRARLRCQGDPRIEIDRSFEVGLPGSRKEQRDDEDRVEGDHEREDEISLPREPRRHESIPDEHARCQDDNRVFRLKSGRRG